MVQHTDSGREEDFGICLVQEAEATVKGNNTTNGKEDARFLPTLKGLSFLAQFL